MKLSGTLKVPRIDLQRYEAALRARMAELITEACFKWLETVKEKIPVWSGASLATLLVLSRQIGFDIEISPVTTSRIPLGLENATGTIKTDGPRYFFEYSTTLEHLVFNEYNNANLLKGPGGHPLFHLRNPGPYMFQEAGQAAFAQYVSKASIPGPFGSVKVVSIRVG